MLVHEVLNTIIVPEAYPIPQKASIMSNLSGSRFLSSIDLETAFWQITLDVQSEEAFTLPQRGHNQFTVVSPSSQVLSRVMNYIFIDMETRIFVYLDDLINFTETFEEHLQVLPEVARRLRSAGLTINAAKSIFCRQSIKYLGYVLDEQSATFQLPSKRNFNGSLKTFHRTASPLTELISLAIFLGQILSLAFFFRSCSFRGIFPDREISRSAGILRVKDRHTIFRVR